MRKRNVKRLRRLRAKQVSVQAELCRRMPCCACGNGPSDPHHLKSRGAGGLDDSCVPMCRVCHSRLHTVGLRFWDIVKVDPSRVLERMHTLVRDSEHEGLAVSPWLAWLE